MHPFARGTLACAVVLSYSVHSRGARTQPEGGAGGSKHWEIPQLRSVRRRKFNLFFGASGESLTVEGVPKVSINAGRDPPALQNVLPQGWFFGFSSAFFYFFFWPSTFFFLFFFSNFYFDHFYFHLFSRRDADGGESREMGGGGEEGKERVGAAAVEGAASRTGEWAAVAARWWVTGGAWMIEAVRRTSQKRKSFELRGEGCA